MWTALATTCVTSSMFLTGLVPNLLALDLVKKTANVEVSWTAWLVGFLPVGVLLVLLVPLLVFWIYPPEIRESREVPAWAGTELAKLGGISLREIEMALLALLALALWIFGSRVVDATTVVLVVISLMVILGVVTWDDVLANKPAWNVLVWFATLVTLADGLNKVGFVGWFAKKAAAPLAGLPPTTVMVLLVFFFAIHYFFASLTAHTTAVLPVILAAGAAVPGMDVRVFALLLCYSLGIMGILTPYATGPSPVYYGSGYVPPKDFWRLGLIFGLIYLASLLAIGVPWLLMVHP